MVHLDTDRHDGGHVRSHAWSQHESERGHLLQAQILEQRQYSYGNWLDSNHQSSMRACPWQHPCRPKFLQPTVPLQKCLGQFGCSES